jgi:hypothetical protein
MNELVEKHTFEKEIDLRNPEIENVIHDIWDSKNVSQWKKDPFYYIRLGESAYKLGQVMFAYDVLIEGLHYFSENLRLNQLFSLSLIKCGYLKRARDILSGLVKKGNHDEETLGILGRVYKDMWILSGQTPSLSSELKMSRNLYFQAFRKNKGYYSGINAASLSLMLGDKQTAEKLAHIVLRICMQIVQSSSSSLYWCLATLGEGNLILGKIEDAKHPEADKAFKRVYQYRSGISRHTGDSQNRGVHRPHDRPSGEKNPTFSSGARKRDKKGAVLHTRINQRGNRVLFSGRRIRYPVC